MAKKKNNNSLTQQMVREENHKLLVAEYREVLGRSYERATLWWAKLKGKAVDDFGVDDYESCHYSWQLLNALNGLTIDVELSDGSKSKTIDIGTQYIDKTFAILSATFGGAKAQSDLDEKREYIELCLSKFKMEALTERLKKASVSILKLHYSDISWNGVDFVFDSRRATYGSSDTMRWILTSEDGISRIISSLGKEQVVINMNTSSEEESEEKKVLITDTKARIFEFGVVDVATGNRYFVSAPSASSTRHVDFPFLKADSHEEVIDLWCQITGCSNLSELASLIGKTKDGKVLLNLAKFKARIAQNGANSLDVSRSASERVASFLRNVNVVYVPDCVGSISKPYKKQGAVGELVFEHEDGTVTSETV